MTFIKYTNDGKAVIQPAALTLSGLEQEETLEMHILEKAIVLLKPDMEPVEKTAAMMTLMRLTNSLLADMMAGWENQEGDADPCDGCSGCGEDISTIWTAPNRPSLSPSRALPPAFPANWRAAISFPSSWPTIRAWAKP